MIDVTYHDTVAVIKLNRGVTNILNMECVRELAAALQRARADPQVQALVLGSANTKFFSIGFDIPQLYELSEEDFSLFYRTFNQTCMELYTLPKPTVAAITGHAIAGGCILALCCDYRLIGEGRKLMGLNEVNLGVPVPYLADCLLRNLSGARYGREILELGQFYQAEESFQMGMVDRVLELEQVLSGSIEKARQLGSMPQQAYQAIKRNRVEGVEAQIRARWEEKQRFFVECWYSDEARERLQEAMKKF